MRLQIDRINKYNKEENKSFNCKISRRNSLSVSSNFLIDIHPLF